MRGAGGKGRREEARVHVSCERARARGCRASTCADICGGPGRGGLAVASEAAIEAALKGAIEQLDTLGRRMAGAAIARCLAQAFGVHA